MVFNDLVGLSKKRILLLGGKILKGGRKKMYTPERIRLVANIAIIK